MFGTLITAGFTDVRTECTHLARELTIARHIARGQAANRGAIHVERDATRHHFDVVLLQAGGGAVIAGVCAGITHVDAGFVLFVSHDDTS